MIELKPCPFCGSTNLELQNLVDAADFFVACEDCEIQQIANHTKEAAVQKWNRRSADADLLEACRKTLFFFNSLRAANDDPLRAIQDRVHGPIRDMLKAAIAKAEGRDG